MFVDLKNKNVLIVGAGNIAMRKIEKLQLFGPTLNVIALSSLPEIEDWAAQGKLNLQKRAFLEEDLKNRDLVIVAVDDIDLQKSIFYMCETQRLMCNCVDSPDYCNFTFPAVVTQGDLCVGISTSGKAPYAAVKIRQLLEKALPQELDLLIAKTENFRNSIPKDEKGRVKKIIDFVEKIFPSLPHPDQK